MKPSARWSTVLSILLLTGGVFAVTARAQSDQTDIPPADENESMPQRGPAGNAHPHESLAHLDINALDPVSRPPTRIVTPQVKYDFSRKVDLSPLVALPIMHNGRVAILQTMARDAVRTMTGRSKYYDLAVPEDGDGSPTKLHYDPLFTYFDILADRAYYDDKPIIFVEYLPMRQSLLEAEFPGDEKTQQFWLHATRVSPTIIFDRSDLINGAFLADLTLQRGRNQLITSALKYRDLHQALLLVAPSDPHGDWTNVALNPKTAPLFASMGQAWRERNASKVNALAKDIAATLATINPQNQPPDWRRSAERLYNGGNNFIFGYTFYFAAFVTLLISFGTQRKSIHWLGVGLLLAGLGVHISGFGLRWVLAQRIPIQNQFESMWGLSMLACTFATTLMFVRRQPVFGVAAAAVGCMALMAATLRGIPGQDIGREAAILNTSYILFYHVNIVLFSYGLISVGFIISLVYLFTYFFTGRSSEALSLAAAGIHQPLAGESSPTTDSANGSTSAPGRERLLNDLDHAQMVVLQLAFWILGVGILLGAWWADHSWGRWWGFDPKEIWALITWIVYLIVIHVRLVAPKRGLFTAILSVIGFFVMLWTYFGVNLLLPGLHAYA